MNKTKRTHRFTEGLHLLIMAALLAGLALGVAPVAHAATFNVADGDVAGLIAAINAANGNAEADTINLAAGGTYTLTAVDNYTDGPNGLPSILADGGNSLTINGNGATIQRSSAGGTPDFRIFHVGDDGDLILNELTITNGDARPHGGGIYNYDGVLTLTNCTVSGNEAQYDGGGICNESEAVQGSTLANCTISDNTAGNEGGGIYHYGDLTLTNSTVSGNEADFGGGIYNDGDLTLTNCTVSDNKATATGTGNGNGGGIFNDETSDLTLTNCTVSGNKANGYGGGIHQTCFTADTLVLLADGSFKRIADVQVGDATLGYDFVANRQVTNVVLHTLQSEADRYLQINGLEVTESHPFAVGPDQWVEAGRLRVGDWVVGDGLTEITHVGRVYESISVYNLTVADTHNYYVSDGSDLFLVHNKPGPNGGQVDLNNVTITNNTADDDNDNDGDGGGIHQDETTTPNFRNTIIAGNIDKSTPTLDDCHGSLSSQGYNLVGTGTGCPSDGTGDQTTTDPKLGPLADNGGPTETHALLPGSPAIDAASCKDMDNNDVTQDQRGVARPQPAGGDCDIGAYEAVARFTLTLNTTGDGTGTVTSEPSGINCGADCAEDYSDGTLVTLTAHPGVKSYFVGWGSDCSGTARTAQVTMDDDKTCIATFGYPVGGIVVPVDRLGLVAPWMGLVALAGLAALGVVVVRKRKS